MQKKISLIQLKSIIFRYIIKKIYFIPIFTFIFLFSQIRFVREVIKISENEHFDGGNKIFIWIGEGDCSQKENMPPMFLMKKNSTLSNINILNAPDGIHIIGDNVKIIKMRNLDVCEDAISTKTYVKNIEIKNSLFMRCRDKAIQLNFGDEFSITNNHFILCRQPIRIPRKTKKLILRNNIYTGVSKEYYLRSKQ